jgi:hypothetical protein
MRAVFPPRQQAAWNTLNSATLGQFLPMIAKIARMSISLGSCTAILKPFLCGRNA